MTVALVRELSPEIVHCELTHLAREPIDLGRARRQHASYVDALRDAGCRIVEVEPLPEAPDGVFVEDAAVVLDELAVVTRPGAVSRRAEIASVESALRPLRTIAAIEAPGTLDGGDVLRSGRVLFVGGTPRSNAAGAASLAAAVARFGYEVRVVPVTGCLHLKSAVTIIGDGTLLINPAWVDPSRFSGWRVVAIDPDEPFAANALRIGNRVLHGRGCPSS